MKDYSKRAKKLAIASAVLFALMIILLLLTLSQAVSEFFATTISRWWITGVGTLFGWLPISFYELFLIVVVALFITALVYIIKHLRHKERIRALCVFWAICVAVFSFGSLYVATAGMAYNRQALPIVMYNHTTATEKLDKTKAIEMAEIYIDNLNSLYDKCQHDSNGYVISGGNKIELLQSIQSAYNSATKQYGNYFSPYNANIKYPLTSWIISQLGISGIFFAPFGEVNVNSYENTFYLPLTMVHEMAHSKGIMREGDANTVARYVCFMSADSYLQYCAYLSCLPYVLEVVSLFPDTEKIGDNLLESVNDSIISQYNSALEYWAQFDLLNGIGEFFNNLYLIVFGQGGTNSYNPPSDKVDSGEVDSEGNPIWIIKSFSSSANLIISLYMNNLLKI